MLLKKLFAFATFISISAFSINVLAAQTPIMSQAELVELLSINTREEAQDFIVLDVRTPEEFSQGHIKNAINISHNTVANNLSILAQHKDKIIVVHCRSGRRAIIAEGVLLENGFLNVRHLEGDMNAWIKANLPVVK